MRFGISFPILSALTSMILFGGSFPAAAAPGDGHWDRQFGMPGTGSRNFALRFKGSTLYTAGASLFNGGITTNTPVNIFDGTNWTVINGIVGGLTVIEDLAFIGTNMYVGGSFSTADGVPAVGLARWDGANWSGVGGFAGVVASLETDGTNLYVGGGFTNAGGVLITNLAKWNGTNWSAIGGGIGSGFTGGFPLAVNVVVWRNGLLYVGGTFTNAGSVGVTNLARWDGSTWSPVGGSVGAENDNVSALFFSGSDLYVGGKFTTAGGVAALNIARWNGSTWSPLGTGLKAPANSNSIPVTGLAFLGTDLYANGAFTNAGGIAASSIARWRGGVWEKFGALNGSVLRSVSNSGSIYFCGDFNIANFNTASNVIGNHIIRFDGTSFHGMAGKGGQGTQFFVQALAFGDDGLYLGGIFNAIATNVASCIARWNGSNWSALAEGVNGSFAGNTLAVRALAARNGDIFVGGGFANAGTVPAINVALWSGGNWSALGYGVDFTVSAVATSPTDVYVGGGFTNAYNFFGSGGVTVNHIASWNASTGWSPLGTGVNGSVNAICVQGGNVYAGGSFTTAGGNTANRIALWDGANWSSLGSGAANGLGGTVNAILVDGTDVYVGGAFTTAGGATARAIAKWNGSTWSPLGQGMFSSSTASVLALAKSGSYLYAAGVFTNAGGTTVTRAIARWDGTNWTSLGSGIANDMSVGVGRGFTIAISGDDLFVGGVFETAGVSDAGYVARWNEQIDFTPRPTMRLINAQTLPGFAFKFRATATENAAYVVDYSEDLLNWSPFHTNSRPWVDLTNSTPGVNSRVFRMREIP